MLIDFLIGASIIAGLVFLVWAITTLAARFLPYDEAEIVFGLFLICGLGLLAFLLCALIGQAFHSWLHAWRG